MIRRGVGVIGIDLGTTNTAVAFVPLQADAAIENIAVPQLTGPGEVAARPLLPSAIWTPAHGDVGSGWQDAAVTLPWEKTPGPVVVGEFARGQGAREPERVVTSSKSWLASAHVERTAAILPWGAEGEHKMSPVRAAMHVLAHVRAAVEHARRQPLDDFDVVITVPASFDEAARDFTSMAAVRAGFAETVLLEEPQAAFYAYLADQGSHGISARQLILVVDVGGGTTDFSLLRVDDSGAGFTRVAVGDHLLLGGDNIDLALAKGIEQEWVAAGRELAPVQWQALVNACQRAKEVLLSANAPASCPVTVAGRGSRLVGQTWTADVSADRLRALLLDGFFPMVARHATPERNRSALQEFGLPYASDAAMTRHLAAFVTRHAHAPIDWVLFNGGATTPQLVRERILDVIASWQGRRPGELASPVPDAAVARGAAHYGLVRRGLAERIRGGSPRCYYVAMGASPDIASDAAASATVVACVAGRGLEEGQSVSLPQPVELVTNRPVAFRLFSSTTRDDAVGSLIPLTPVTDVASELHELPPLVTVARTRGASRASVHIETRLTELGTLELHCVEASGTRHRLAFEVRTGRGASSGGAPGPTTDPLTGGCIAIAKRALADGGARLTSLMRDLEAQTGLRRDEWSLALVRGVFDGVIGDAGARRQSPEHEQRLIGLLGYLARPGQGVAADEFRAKQLFGLFLEGAVFGKSEPCRAAYWVMMRRVAPGLSLGQQTQLSDRVQAVLLRQGSKAVEAKLGAMEAAEVWRCIAALELLPATLRRKYADEAVRRVTSLGGKVVADPLWLQVLARLAGRAPWFGPVSSVIAPSVVSDYVAAVLPLAPAEAALGLAQLVRRTGDRVRDVPEATRLSVLAWLEARPGTDHAQSLVRDIVPHDAREEKLAFGDALPLGLRLPGVG